nr:stage V sporulation protein AC [Calidifontibacillus oryziterrae]
MTKENYLSQIKPFQPKPSIIKNGGKAFIIGGLICLFGQALQNMYIELFDFTEKTAINPTLATLILLTALLTGFGVYDKLGQFAGAGSIVLITGFANAMTSAALEHKSEGIVLGIANNMFKIAGAVIVYGVVAATVTGFLRYTIKYLLS